MATGTQLEKSPSQIPLPADFPGRVAALWTRARIWWAGLNPRQRGYSVATALGLAALVGSLAWYCLRTDWRTLYTGLEPDDARQMGAILSAAQIPYDVSDNGAGIRVAASQLDKARLATAAKGGTRSGRLGFELFDKPNWVGSEFDEQVNYQRALEGELEHTVGTLSDIESARVHLVLAHDSLFRDLERPAKASVVLKLRHRSLADGEPEAIRNLVASAVDGLTADRVVLVDAAGNLPLGPRTPEAAELAAEQSLEEKLISTLEPVTGAGNVRASVTLDYNPTATDETQEIYDPNQSATLSMQRTEQATGPTAVAAGVPGASSNAPNAQPAPVYPRETSEPQSAKTEASTYGVSKTLKHLSEGPGRVRRLTAAIVVNDRLLRAADQRAAAQWQPRSQDELRNLTALAQASIGFDSARGDVLTVQDIAFDGNRPTPPEPLLSRVLAQIESSPLLVKYLALLFFLLLVLGFGVRPALRQIAAVSHRAAPAADHGPRELAAGAGAAKPSIEMPEVDVERLRGQEIFEQVTQHLKREPTQSSRLLQSWIHSD
jgi:flagellar M-ring protein FliF